MSPSPPLPFRGPGAQDPSLTCKLGAPIKARPPPAGTYTTTWALSPGPRAALGALRADSERSGVLKSSGWGLCPPAGAKGERAVTPPSDSLSWTDLQATDGEEAPGAHQRVAGAAQVAAGEALFAPGEPGRGGGWCDPSLASPRRGLPAESPSHPPQIRKRKLEKADILELSVKYMKSLQSSVQGRGGPGRVGGGSPA